MIVGLFEIWGLVRCSDAWGEFDISQSPCFRAMILFFLFCTFSAGCGFLRSKKKILAH